MTHSTAKTTRNLLSETIALRLPLDDCIALVAISRQQDRSISWLVRNLISAYLRNQQQAG